MPTANRTAANVRAEAARRGHSGIDVGRTLNLSRSAVHRRMRGYTPFTLDELAKLAEWFDMPIGDLIADEKASA